MVHEGKCNQLSPHLIQPALSVQLTIARSLLHNSMGIPLSIVGDSDSNAELPSFSILIVPLDPTNHEV